MTPAADHPGPREGEATGPTPADALALIEAETRRARRAVNVDDRLLYATWGVAWFVAYLVTYVTNSAEDGAVAWLQGLVWPVAMGAAMVVTVRHVRTVGAGLRGSDAQGALVGIGFFVSIVGGAGIGLLLVPDGMPGDERFLLPSAGIVTAVAIHHIGQGSAWADRLQMSLGAWLLGANAISIALGWQWYPLGMAVGGGGGFLVAALVSHLLQRRAPSRPLALPAP